MWCREGGRELNGVDFRFSGAVLSDQLAVLLLVDDLPGGTSLRVISQGHPAYPHVFLWFIYAVRPSLGTAKSRESTEETKNTHRPGGRGISMCDSHLQHKKSKEIYCKASMKMQRRQQCIAQHG